MDRLLITCTLMLSQGWDIREIGDNGPATPKEYRNRYEVWVHRDNWNKCDQHRKAVIHDCYTGEWSRDGKELVYMDQISVMN